jgi:molybdopterin synthase catalytic subunit
MALRTNIHHGQTLTLEHYPGMTDAEIARHIEEARARAGRISASR